MFYNPDVERHMADFQDVGDPYQEHVEFIIHDFRNFPLWLKLRTLKHLIAILIYS